MRYSRRGEATARKRKRAEAEAKVAEAAAAKAKRLKAVKLAANPPLPKVCLGCGNVFYSPGRRCSGCASAPAQQPVSVRTVSGGLPTLGKGRR